MVAVLVAFALITADSAPSNRIANAEAELAAAKESYLLAVKNKSDLETAAANYGEVVVLSPVLAPMEKYPLALALFRQVLAINPANTKAKDWEKQIVDIYASLGKTPTEFDLSNIK